MHRRLARMPWSTRCPKRRPASNLDRFDGPDPPALRAVIARPTFPPLQVCSCVRARSGRCRPRGRRLRRNV